MEVFVPGWLGGARAAEATVASDEQVTMSRVRDADEADNIPPRLVVEVEGIVPAWIGQAGSFLTGLPGEALNSITWPRAEGGPMHNLPASEALGPAAVPAATHKYDAGSKGAVQGESASKAAPAGRVALSVASAAEASRGAILLAMLQDGFSRRKNGQDVNWLNANTAAGRRASERGEQRGVGTEGEVGTALAHARGGASGTRMDDCRVAMEMLQEGMPASWSAGRGCKGGGGWGAGGAAGGRLMEGAGGFIANGDSVDAASLESELQARIVVLAARGVDTSNDEQLARALQEMLDQEYEEELSLCLCEQLEQEEQDRVVAMRLEREGQPIGYSPGNINNYGAARFGKAHVAAVLSSQVEQDRKIAMQIEQEEAAQLQQLQTAQRRRPRG